MSESSINMYLDIVLKHMVFQKKNNVFMYSKWERVGMSFIFQFFCRRTNVISV